MLPKFVTIKDFIFVGICALVFLLVYDKYISKKIEPLDNNTDNSQDAQNDR